MFPLLSGPKIRFALPLDTLQLRFPLMLFSGAFLVIPHRQKLIMVIGRCVHLRATLPNVHNVLHVFVRTCHVRRYSRWSIDPRHHRLPLLAVVVCFQHLLNKWGVLCLAILPAQTTPENNHLPLVANCSFYSTTKSIETTSEYRIIVTEGRRRGQFVILKLHYTSRFPTNKHSTKVRRLA